MSFDTEFDYGVIVTSLNGRVIQQQMKEIILYKNFVY